MTFVAAVGSPIDSALGGQLLWDSLQVCRWGMPLAVEFGVGKGRQGGVLFLYSSRFTTRAQRSEAARRVGKGNGLSWSGITAKSLLLTVSSAWVA